MSAERLREAARVLRERAGFATPGPWEFQPWSTYALPSGDYAESILMSAHAFDGEITRDLPDHDGDYIATMHPGVALAIAAWLEATAEVIVDDEEPVVMAAVSVADAVLGPQS